MCEDETYRFAFECPNECFSAFQGAASLEIGAGSWRNEPVLYQDRSELGLAQQLGFDCRIYVNTATMFRRYRDVAARSTLMFSKPDGVLPRAGI